MRIVYKGNYIRMTCGEIGLVREQSDMGSYCLQYRLPSTAKDDIGSAVVQCQSD